MRRTVYYWMVVLSLCVGLSVAAAAQANPTGTLAGTVTDPSHAAIPGADIAVTGVATGLKLTAQSGADGHFSIANVAPGQYTVTVTKTGFATRSYQAVTVAANQTYNLNPTLQVGAQTSTVTVEAGQSVIQAEQTSVGTSITGKVITDLPSASSSSSLYSLTQTDPAIQTMGAPRQSSAEGLPGGAVNITIDGINAQWEAGKSGDPVFTMITPNVSDTSEFDVVSAAGSANQTGEGAVQINFTSNRGTNTFHGSAFDYFRNDALNSNYYFNNLSGQPRPVMRFNQWGFSIGGPIWKNKLFFFFDITKFSQPEGQVSNATLLTPAAAGGNFAYVPVDANGNPAMPSSTPSWVTCTNNGSPLCTANLMGLAANYGQPSTIDPLIGKMLSEINGATSAPGVTMATPPSLYQQQIAFPLSGSNAQQNPDFRADYNLNANHSFEFDYHLSRLIIFPDDLNGGGYTFPVAPFNANQYGYGANRAIWSWAWRWAVSPTMSNELRYGFQNSPESYNFGQGTAIYPTMSTNLGSILIQPQLPGEITNPWHGYGTFQDWDNVYQLNDNFAWVRGAHNYTFGMTASRATYKDLSSSNVVAGVGVGLNGSEPINSDLTSSNLPGISAADLSAAGDIYGMLVGNVTSYNSTVAFDPSKRAFVTGAPGRDQYHQTDIGLYAADSWRVRPNLTFNYGLRWQYEGVPVDDLNEYFIANGGAGAAYGISGAGNLFQPGTMTGALPTFTNDLNKSWYKNWYKGFAPSIGASWEPTGGLFGNSGDTVLRAGYSISYSREGLQNWNSISASNPGYSGAQFDSGQPTASGPGTFAAGSEQIGSLSLQSVAQSPSSFQTTIPLVPNSSVNYLNAIAPNLHMPYVQSWTAGIQRALGPHTAVEVRYVGNHGVGLWQQLNLNEVNVFENGFLNEFKQAQANLAACNAAVAGCPVAGSFANQGLPGQAAVPILTAAFTGSKNGSQSDGSFTNGTFVKDLNNGLAGSLASSLANNYTRWQNLVAAGYPSNLFLVNPDAQGGSYLLHNGLGSTYNAMIVEVRHRPVRGLTLNASYTYSKSLTDDWQRSGSNYEDEVTLRDPGYMKGPAPFDIRNAFKFFSLWELPFGKGERWANTSGLLNDVVGGWSFDSNILLQSGRPGLLTGGLGGTFNQSDGGVILSGMSQQALQSQLSVYKTPNPAPGAVWYFPQALLGPNGTRTNTSVLQACNTPGQLCQRMFLYDAPFFMPDFSLVKNTKLTERIGTVVQVQFLNAFNNANFFWTGSSQTFGTAGANLQSNTFGRITHAYQAVDSNSDHGGRTIQIVAKVTF